MAHPQLDLAAGFADLVLRRRGDRPRSIRSRSYLEKRHHELWITTGTVSVLLWKANKVEARKALRQIQRARERHRESYGV